ncbi:MAG: hypothetical protein AMS24_02280 [Chlamydiae bacterium SM23_39]|nr:MAG: hypothetical protein AMS24_02280 [Chlamydiae bacterium SM23_39]
MTYQLIDSGYQKKLEKIGDYSFIRPAASALWPSLFKEKWKNVDAVFSRNKGNKWDLKKEIPDSWIIEINNLKLKVKMTEFGHMGFFPEHEVVWKELEKFMKKRDNLNILNLFAYTGAATLISARNRSKICHVDGSKPSILWAKENAKLNNLEKSSIRWILDDVRKFLKREINRKVKYEGIILDPPTFGRGPKKEIFKIERDIVSLLEMCKELFSANALFLIISSHTSGITKGVLENLLRWVFKRGIVKTEDMEIISKYSFSVPSGSYALWKR